MSSFNYNNFVPYKGQNYIKLRAAVLQTGMKFRDPEFPPTDASLFSSSRKNAGIVWRRAQEINSEARLFVDGISSRDIIQGDLGNCWLVAAFCALAVHRNNWSKVIPDYREQDFDNNQTGVFHFRFWRFGYWTDVVIDDFLPTRKGQLLFCHAPSKNEFWPALVEKAYAKLYGSYEALNGGELAEALEDFTGGVTESFDINEEHLRTSFERKAQFYEFLNSLMKNDALICAAVPALTDAEMEKQTPLGLVKGHAYAVTVIQTVHLKGYNLGYRDPLPMVRMRNPWGGIEWMGAFSDRSPEWTKISEADKSNMGLVFADDGEFWMTFDDFIKNFENIALCHNINTAPVLSMASGYYEYAFHSEWATPDRTGGCINFKKTFLNNPQYVFDIPNGGDELMIHLIQKSNRNPGDDRLTIGFTIMQVELNRKFRTNIIQKIIVSSIFRNSRSIFLRYAFNRGRYIIIPCIFEPGQVGGFLLRIYSTYNINARELIYDRPQEGPFNVLPWNAAPRLVTQVKVMKANGLLAPSSTATEINPYCVIKCGSKKVISSTKNKTSNPIWNTAALFYRKHAAKDPIYIEVWNKNPFFDILLGRQVYIAAEEMKNEVVELPLIIKNKDGSEVSNGLLAFTFIIIVIIILIYNNNNYFLLLLSFHILLLL
ncbi:hypothetical protein HELRODRAFT_106710 [Helobdella robusta]|uniref:Calpain catalytic domain-containing protein n=1 Tax=Helobdella robusta TaxID=6412 RepID=T1EE39_HELRO|nr:hypothetical protein HELRODRAFT_106710 [Helobdella robusta]ESO02542.1 hypothetical protein HELRODRAFT_106710 [Helobdella robusta]